MNSAIAILRAEHDLILHALEATDEAAARLEHGHPLPPDSLPALLQFLSFFVHRSHRDKEEELLLPAMQDKGFPDPDGCVGALLADHAEGAHYFQELVSAGETYRIHGRDGLRLALAVRRYSAAMRRHISHEEQVLFGSARQLLAPEESDALAREFKHIDERAQRAGLTEIMDRFERAVCDLRK